MTELEKIKVEIERLKESGCASPIVICDTLLAFIDSLQEEPVRIKKGCKYLCLGDMFNNDTGKISFIGGKIYLAPEDNTLVSEENGWRCDTSEDASNFELVEEPVSDDLDIAIGEYCSNPDNFITYIDVAFAYRSEQKDDIPLIIKAIRFGAKWQKQQIMEDAMPCVLSWYDGFVPEFTQEQLHNVIEKNGLDVGDKISVIILKQDD